MYDSTIKDIAKMAGVSTTTVSRVLNNSTSLRESTRQKVLAVIERENYTPSAAARSLSKRVSDTIGVILPELDNPFFGELLRGITEIIDSNGLTMICCNSDDSLKKDMKALELLRHHRVRGLIYTPAVDYREKKDKKMLEQRLKAIDTPVILVDRKLEGFSLDGVYFDDTKNVYNATKVLINAGHRKIGIINASLDRYLARIRQQGYEQALSEFDLPIEQRYIFVGDYTADCSYELTKSILSMVDPPTAVITCSNRTSIGFLKAVYEAGKSIPKDISCIGLDSIEILDIVGVNFDCVFRDSKEMGRKAVELLINRIAFPDRPKQDVTIDSPLIIKKI